MRFHPLLLLYSCWEHGYGSLFPFVTVYAIYLLLCHCFILYRGIKTASNTIEKKARIITFIALIGRDFFGYIIGVIFSYFGLQAHAFYGLAPILMCFLLTYGLLRMQWETIQDLKDGLDGWRENRIRWPGLSINQFSLNSILSTASTP
ncbi:MAG: hypothetical protein PVF29_15425 [Desulfobacterales bacterium]|jgi:hypothetical protein